ncbi:hypothetical protein V5799_020484 [Amblyomma americanum]|uniref:Uncharacterized protein n=1 Tax=Amblyomma americanum TaxID=6943 RepID=A0AAQ4EUB6_AMBAM
MAVATMTECQSSGAGWPRTPNVYNIKCPSLCLPGQAWGDPCTRGCRCGIFGGKGRNGRWICYRSVPIM